MKNTFVLIFFILVLSGIIHAQVVKEDFSFSDITVVDNLTPGGANQTKPLKSFINKLNEKTWIRCHPLPFNLKVEFFQTADKNVVTAFIFQTDLKEIVFEDISGVPTAKLYLFGYLISGKDGPKHVFEEKIEIPTTIEKLIEVKNEKATYVKAVMLPAGYYEITGVERDRISDCRGINTIKFRVAPNEFNNGK